MITSPLYMPAAEIDMPQHDVRMVSFHQYVPICKLTLSQARLSSSFNPGQGIPTLMKLSEEVI